MSVTTFPAYYEKARAKYGTCSHSMYEKEGAPRCGRTARFIVRSDIQGVEWIGLCGIHERVWRRALPYVLIAELRWGKVRPRA